jgi:hypothetical protein
VAELIKEFAEILGLTGDAPGEILASGGIAERGPCGFGQGFEVLGDGLLLFDQPARVVAHAAHVIGELARVAVAEIVADLFELAVGACAGGEGIGDGPLFDGLGGALQVGSGLIELLSGLGVLGLELGLIHALLEFIDVGKHASLLFLESFELAKDLLAFLGGARFLEGDLKFLESFVKVLLALGEFTEPGEEFELLALLLGRGGGGLALSLVTVFRFPKLELIELTLGATGLAAAATAGLSPGDLIFVGLKTEDGLVSGLLSIESWRKGLGRNPAGSAFEVLNGATHFGLRGFEEGRGCGVGGLRGELRGLLEGMFLGLPDDRGILGEAVRNTMGTLTLERPCGRDDLFLQFGQLFTRTAILLAGLVLTVATGGLTFPEDFVKGADLDEIHVGESAADGAIGPEIIGPKEVGEKLAWNGVEIFEWKEMLEGDLFVGWRVGTEFEEAGFLAAQAIGQSVRLQPEIVRNFSAKQDFFERRGPVITAGREQFDVGRLVAEDLDVKIGGVAIGPSGVIDGREGVALALIENERKELDLRTVGVGCERDGRLVGGGQEGGGNRFVEMEREFEACALDGADAAGVRYGAGFEPGIIRVEKPGVGAFEARVLEDGDKVLRRLTGTEIDTVAQIVRDGGNGAAKDGIVQVPREGDLELDTGPRGNDQSDRGRGLAGKLGQDNEALPAFDGGIAGGNEDGGLVGGDRGRRGDGSEEIEHGQSRNEEGLGAAMGALGEKKVLEGPMTPWMKLVVGERLLNDTLLKVIESPGPLVGVLFDRGEEQGVEPWMLAFDLLSDRDRVHSVASPAPVQQEDGGDRDGDENGDERGPTPARGERENQERDGDEGGNGPRASEPPGQSLEPVTLRDGLEFVLQQLFERMHGPLNPILFTRAGMKCNE